MKLLNKHDSIITPSLLALIHPVLLIIEMLDYPIQPLQRILQRERRTLKMIKQTGNILQVSLQKLKLLPESTASQLHAEFLVFGQLQIQLPSFSSLSSRFSAVLT